MKTLTAYHNKPSEKKALLKQLRAHAVADEIVKGKYWENGKGCAIGCILHSDNHAELEPRFGVPVHIGYLVDVIFENLPNALAKAWPERFAKAIKPGSDLSKVYPLFTVWMLTDPKDGVIRFADKNGEKAIRAVSDLFLSRANGKEPSAAAWDAASAAASAAARDAAWDAARAAAWAAAWDAARDAAWDAAWDAASAAAWDAASAAARDAAWDAAWDAARAAAWAAAFVKMSDKLIELIEAAPSQDKEADRG